MSGANMPLADRRVLGRFGEAAAAAQLIRQGYTIIDRNWRCSLGEIDLIARQGECLVFVEVRTRRGPAPPLESITPAKQRRLRALAYAYLEKLAGPEALWRIDLVAVNIDRHGLVAGLEHLPYAVGE